MCEWTLAAVDCDNVTHPLNQNADTGSSTEEYEYELDDVDDNTRSPVSVNSNTIASATVVPTSASASCDVCLDGRVSKLP